MKKACTWLRENISCSSLIFLPGPAWVLLGEIYKPFPGSLYNESDKCATFCPYPRVILIVLNENQMDDQVASSLPISFGN